MCQLISSQSTQAHAMCTLASRWRLVASTVALGMNIYKGAGGGFVESMCACNYLTAEEHTYRVTRGG